MKFSLIIATAERVSRVETLLNSLCAQSVKDFEVIIVDQNDDQRLASVVEHFAGKLNLVRLRSEVKKLSYARNLGSAAARGEILAYPDDDCIYPDDVLARVASAFEADSGLGVLSGPASSPAGQLGSGRWQPGSCTINMRTVWTSVIAFNLFIRHDLMKAVGGFDERLGIGAEFGSAEETDLVIRVIRTGGRCYYDFDLRVIHPDKSLSPLAAARAFRYGTGLGHVLRKHQVNTGTVLSFLIRPLGGMAVSLAMRNFVAADYYWKTMTGRLSGFVADRPKEIP
jgi:glycosyltransferase involved in cell wall biosynthesis